MTRRLVGCLPVMLVALGIWLARRLRGRPPEPPPPEDGVQPVDVYLVTLSRDDPRIGTFSRN